MKKIICILLCIALLASFGCSKKETTAAEAPKAEDAQKTEQVSPSDIAVASASSGGTAYYIVAGQTTILNEKKLLGITFTNEATTGAPSVNCPYVSQDPTMMAYTPFDGLYAAVSGDAERGFPEPLTNLGFIYGGHMLYLYFVTLADSPINGIEDLAGKRISLPPKGTTGYFQSRAVLSAYGLDPDKDVNASPMNYTDASDSLKDGALDCIIVNGGLNQSTVTELDTTKSIKFLTINDEAAAVLATKNPYWTVEPLPEGCYKQQPEGLKVIDGSTCLIANMALSDDIVYEITKTLLSEESIAKMTTIHTDGAAWNLENSLAMIEKGICPIHPGALRYYKEIGAIK